MEDALLVIPLLVGYTLDLVIGDPDNQPHPVRFFGTMIYRGEKKWNQGERRFFKGAVLSVMLCLFTYVFFQALGNVLMRINLWLAIAVNCVWIWYGLANKNLITEGRNVFRVLEKEGMKSRKKTTFKNCWSGYIQLD